MHNHWILFQSRAYWLENWNIRGDKKWKGMESVIAKKDRTEACYFFLNHTESRWPKQLYHIAYTEVLAIDKFEEGYMFGGTRVLPIKINQQFF